MTKDAQQWTLQAETETDFVYAQEGKMFCEIVNKSLLAQVRKETKIQLFKDIKAHFDLWYDETSGGFWNVSCKENWDEFEKKNTATEESKQ